MDNELPDFYALEDALLRLDAGFSAAEVHGIATAVLAVNNNYDFKAWLAQILKGDTQDIFYQEAMQLLRLVYQATLTALNSNSLDFALLMPPETEDLSAQVEALQKWAQGFAFGLAISGLGSLQDLPDDTREWVEDLIKIGAAGEVDVADEDESEQALDELLSFIRVGVLLMNEEMQPIKGMPYRGKHHD